MAYLIRSSNVDHIDLLSCTLNHWAKDDEDIFFISLEGHRIYSSKRLVGFYSPVLSPLLMSSPSFCIGVSLPFSSSSITSLISLLSKGSTQSSPSQVSEVKAVASSLGITLNCSLDSSDKGNITFHETTTSLHNGELMEETLKENATGSQEEIWCVDGICSKKFIDTLALNNHTMMKHGKTKVDYVSVKKANKQENATEIGQESSLNCDKCGKDFVNIKKLKIHKSKHTGPGEGKCEECEKYFEYKASLKRHMNLHIDKLPFKCKHCDKEFSRKGNMKSHINLCHQEILDTLAVKDVIKAGGEEAES